MARDFRDSEHQLMPQFQVMNRNGFEEVQSSFQTQSQDMAAGSGNWGGPFASGSQSISPPSQLPSPQTPYGYQNGSRMREQGRMWYNPPSTGLYDAQETHYNSSWEGPYNTQGWGPAPAGINTSRRGPLQQDSMRPRQSPSRFPPPHSKQTHLGDLPNNQRRGGTSQQGRDRNSRSTGRQASVNAVGVTSQASQAGRSGRRVTHRNSSTSRAGGEPKKTNSRNSSHAPDKTSNEAAGRNARQQEKGPDLDSTQRSEVLQTLDGFTKKIEGLRQQLMPASSATEDESEEDPRKGSGEERKGG
ncbi:hypothetical protein K449DRAFT_439909 [Hypoxylon sp. EC38]|nr:hypothetical protein K449DRAFT_439909 [Hypoxylon sp. EC38]